ncbi:hypothetical protein [Halobacillus halophilus]|nr:hypothetical protein [Halobacillus halophilus]
MLVTQESMLPFYRSEWIKVYAAFSKVHRGNHDAAPDMYKKRKGIAPAQQ